MKIDPLLHVPETERLGLQPFIFKAVYFSMKEDVDTSGGQIPGDPNVLDVTMFSRIRLECGLSYYYDY